MGELIEFLRARFDDDERVVRVDPGLSQEWHTEVARDDPRDEGRACVRSSQGDVITGDVDVERAEHIAHYDPARMLREVEAKRKLLDDLFPDIEGMDGAIEGEWGHHNPAADRLLEVLALPYADHDDYKEEWRP